VAGANAERVGLDVACAHGGWLVWLVAVGGLPSFWSRSFWSVAFGNAGPHPSMHN